MYITLDEDVMYFMHDFMYDILPHPEYLMDLGLSQYAFNCCVIDHVLSNRRTSPIRELIYSNAEEYERDEGTLDLEVALILNRMDKLRLSDILLKRMPVLYKELHRLDTCTRYNAGIYDINIRLKGRGEYNSNVSTIQVPSRLHHRRSVAQRSY